LFEAAAESFATCRITSIIAAFIINISSSSGSRSDISQQQQRQEQRLRRGPQRNVASG
jgi:hypothetical protein